MSNDPRENLHGSDSEELADVTADAAAWWRQGPWGVQLNVYNITDARYIVSSHGANGNMNLPGAPRNVMLKLSYRM